MIEEQKQFNPPHNIIMEGRKNLSISGVKDLESFDENSVVLITSMGELTIRGSELHISKTNLDTGELQMDGTITDLSYSEHVPNSNGSIFKRIFRP
jgi:sporulation protein YabP